MNTSHRLLGFAFAAADLLIEVTPNGRIAFAMGAGEALIGLTDAAMTKRRWFDLVDPSDHPMLQSMFGGLLDGARAGPVTIKVATPKDAPERFATLTAMRMPGNKQAISCVLSRANARGPAGLQSRESFEARASTLLSQASHDLDLTFIELAGLSLSEKAAADPEKLQAVVAGILRAQAYQGEAPAAIGPDRYALLKDSLEPSEVLIERVGRILSGEGYGDVAPASASVPMTGVTQPKQVIKALRYAVELVMQNGLNLPLPADLAGALDQATRSTMHKAGALGSAIRQRQFTLAYQPVVSLTDGSLHHHEVLVRFGEEASPFPTIRMAEEMDLIESLDVAILEETLAVMKRDPTIVLAVNVSGRSIMSDDFVTRVLGLLKGRPDVRGRLMFELTESAAVEDLAVADRHIQAFRRAGCEVCLDDFGAGAASLAYLQQLTLDVLKIDGRYIRDLQFGGREATFVKHLVNMCAELNVRTLAEMVETPEAQDAVRAAGVDYAQGWLYGRASDTPIDAEDIAARSRGRSGALQVRSLLNR